MHQIATRLNQIILIATFIGFSWLAMQVVHELGHVLGALLTGGQVIQVVLRPLTISQTDVYPNPSPLFVVWAGPIVGAVLPLAAFLLAAAARSPALFLFRFFAGFCLIVNGAYIGPGAFWRVADPGDMLRLGSETWQLVLFTLLTAPLGLYLWHGLGPQFGLGSARGKVSRSATITSLALFVGVVVIEIIIDNL